jgi:hypothetical protein
VILYYDRTGDPLDLDEWVRLHADKDYVVVGRDTLSYGGGEILVSTVWLGINHNWIGGRPLIFETMVFGAPWDEYEEMHRYSTEEEARLGHAGVLEMVGLKLMMHNRTERSEEHER